MEKVWVVTDTKTPESLRAFKSFEYGAVLWLKNQFGQDAEWKGFDEGWKYYEVGTTTYHCVCCDLR